LKDTPTKQKDKFHSDF